MYPQCTPNETRAINPIETCWEEVVVRARERNDRTQKRRVMGSGFRLVGPIRGDGTGDPLDRPLLTLDQKSPGSIPGGATKSESSS